ncbi:MAG: hypothetical protein IJ493_12100 [Clostridia bacterium]|nr:hypothetical protein [Clostridia bacterium]
MAKFERQLRARAADLAEYLSRGIQESGLSVEMVDTSVHRMGGVSIYFTMYDRYYMRNSSRAALSVLVAGDSDMNTTVTAISGGGGNGTFLSFSWGAEEDFIGVVEGLVDRYINGDKK